MRTSEADSNSSVHLSINRSQRRQVALELVRFQATSSDLGGKRAHDRAVGPSRRLAFVDQGGQRPLKLPEIGYLAANICAMPDRDIARLLAAGSALVQAHELADRLQRETEFAPSADEGQRRDVLGRVAAVSSSCTLGFGQHADLFVVANSLDVNARQLGQTADGEWHWRRR